MLILKENNIFLEYYCHKLIDTLPAGACSSNWTSVGLRYREWLRDLLISSIPIKPACSVLAARWTWALSCLLRSRGHRHRCTDWLMIAQICSPISRRDNCCFHLRVQRLTCGYCADDRRIYWMYACLTIETTCFFVTTQCIFYLVTAINFECRGCSRISFGFVSHWSSVVAALCELGTGSLILRCLKTVARCLSSSMHSFRCRQQPLRNRSSRRSPTFYQPVDHVY